MAQLVAVAALLVASLSVDAALLGQLKAVQDDPKAARRVVRMHQAETAALLDGLLEQFDQSIHSARTRPEQRRVEYDAATLQLGIKIGRLYADVTRDTRRWRQFRAREVRIEGTKYLNDRRYSVALSKLEAALREAEALNDVWLMVITRLNLAYARLELGNGALARDLCARAAQDATALGPRAKGLAAFDLASAYIHLGEFAASIPYAEAAVRYSREARIKLWEGNALLNLGIAYRQIGELDTAESRLDEALAVITQTSDQLGTGRALYDLALVSLDRRSYAKAAAYLERALPFIERVDLRHSHEIELDPKHYYNRIDEDALRLLVHAYTELHDATKTASYQAALDALLRAKPRAAEPRHTHGN